MVTQWKVVGGARTVQGGLSLIEVATGEVRVVRGLRAVTGTSWSPDGSSRRVLGTDDLIDVYDVEWSPDGSRLAVLHHPVDPPTVSLLTLAADGSDVQMVALCENGEDRDRLCASNGGSVAGHPTVSVSPSGTSTAAARASPCSRSAERPSRSPDGSFPGAASRGIRPRGRSHRESHVQDVALDHLVVLAFDAELAR